MNDRNPTPSKRDLYRPGPSRQPEDLGGHPSYLIACFEEAPDDAAYIAAALGDVARARGMTKLAQRTGLTRMGLYKALSKDGNPSLDTVLKVLHALGLRLTAKSA